MNNLDNKTLKIPNAIRSDTGLGGQHLDNGRGPPSSAQDRRQHARGVARARTASTFVSRPTWPGSRAASSSSPTATATRALSSSPNRASTWASGRQRMSACPLTSSCRTR